MSSLSMILLAALAAALIGAIFVDAFEAVILPRRVRHGYRLARFFYRATWTLWRALGRRLPAGRVRLGFLAVFGPLSLFGLLAVWAAGLITGFALLHLSLGTELFYGRTEDVGFTSYLYFSGTTFFTLGYGDVVPTGPVGRFLSVCEAGIGFAFLAVIISYLPVVYQSFSRREITISLLDARGGSPPTAGELLRRSAGAPGLLNAFLVEWERWSAELLENQLSYPVLRFYRSQHDNQSWVAALTAILDTSAILIVGVEGADYHQARLTFAMARHAAVDLALVTKARLLPPKPDRLPPAAFARLWETLKDAGLKMREGPTTAAALADLRSLYEPIVNALAADLELALPPFQPDRPPVDNWQTSPWMAPTPGLGHLHEHAD